MDVESIRVLTQTLSSDSLPRIRSGLRVTDQIKSPKLMAPLMGLLSHENAEIRKNALHQLIRIGNNECSDKIENLLADEHAEVRSEAIHFLYRFCPNDRNDQLRKFLSSPDPILRASTFRSALENRFDIEIDDLLSKSDVISLLDIKDETNLIVRREISSALRFAPVGSNLEPLLPRFMTDPDPQVRRNALLACGSMQAKHYLPKLVESLGDPSLRGIAFESILGYGTSILNDLDTVLTDSTTPVGVKLRVPKLISVIGGKQAEEILFNRLKTKDTPIRHRIVKGLNRLYRNDSRLRVDRKMIEKLWMQELEEYYQILDHAHAINQWEKTSPAISLLRRALKERMAHNLELAFRFLGLIYPPDDMLNSYQAILSNQGPARANAIEFLDTIWAEKEKQLFFPILERKENQVQIGRKIFKRSEVPAKKSF